MKKYDEAISSLNLSLRANPKYYKAIIQKGKILMI